MVADVNGPAIEDRVAGQGHDWSSQQGIALKETSQTRKAKALRNRVRPLASEAMQAKCEEGPINAMKTLAPEPASGQGETMHTGMRSNSFERASEISSTAF